jgi:hypothetical protein
MVENGMDDVNDDSGANWRAFLATISIDWEHLTGSRAFTTFNALGANQETS